MYENFRHGKDIISPILANLFTYMLQLAYILDNMKRGIIVTLHKEGNKPKDDQNCYRAITLSSCVLKLYEVMLLDRYQETIQSKLSIQQGGFQSGLGCIMTSFKLRECLQFVREHSSKVFLCFLDGKQAFNHIWHMGLYYKLIQYNIDSTTLLSLCAMYRNSHSQVRCQGLLLSSFPVLKGTR